MNAVDLGVGVVLFLFALRGYLRGFFRECFGFLGLVIGVVAALRCTALGESVLEEHFDLPAQARAGLAFVAIFVGVQGALSLVGILLGRLAKSPSLAWLSGLGGALFGVGKASAVLAFILLFLHLFPVVSSLDPKIMESTVGRPLVTTASSALRLVLPSASQPSAEAPN